MKKTTKILSVLLALMMVLPLFGCSKKTEAGTDINMAVLSGPTGIGASAENPRAGAYGCGRMKENSGMEAPAASALPCLIIRPALWTWDYGAIGESSTHHTIGTAGRILPC